MSKFAFHWNLSFVRRFSSFNLSFSFFLFSISFAIYYIVSLYYINASPDSDISACVRTRAISTDDFGYEWLYLTSYLETEGEEREREESHLFMFDGNSRLCLIKIASLLVFSRGKQLSLYACCDGLFGINERMTKLFQQEVILSILSTITVSCYFLSSFSFFFYNYYLLSYFIVINNAEYLLIIQFLINICGTDSKLDRHNCTNCCINTSPSPRPHNVLTFNLVIVPRIVVYRHYPEWFVTAIHVGCGWKVVLRPPPI